MKKATLTVSFDSEKLDALTYHMVSGGSGEKS